MTGDKKCKWQRMTDDRLLQITDIDRWQSLTNDWWNIIPDDR